MREWIARILRCGMPRDVAVCICGQYAKRKDWLGLENYVYSVEEETRERDDDAW